MNTIEDIGVFAVPCNQVVILTKEDGEEILRQSSTLKHSKERREQIIRDANKLLKKPDKR